jgi:hypothetical protein
MLGKVFHKIYFHKMWSVGMALIVGICEMWANTDGHLNYYFNKCNRKVGYPDHVTFIGLVNACASVVPHA